MNKWKNRLWPPGWPMSRNVSLPQARDFLTAMLQSRGYHFPVFSLEGDADVRPQSQRIQVRLPTGGTIEKNSR